MNNVNFNGGPDNNRVELDNSNMTIFGFPNVYNLEPDDYHNRNYITRTVLRYHRNRRNVVIPPEPQIETHYDQNLTAAHKYVGDGLLEASGHTVYEEGIIHSLPVIFLNLNLMPGQILPILAHSPNVTRIIKYAFSHNRSFGVCYSSLLKENKRMFGTIADVFEHSAGIETSQILRIKARGHQRFEILEANQFPGSCARSIALAKIKIVPDITLTHPYNKLCLHPKKRYMSHSEMSRKSGMWQNQWPDWVYKQFDAYELASRLSKKVKMLYKNVKLSDDPYLLSFQVTRLGIFSQEQISELLGLESTNLRLQYELQYWNRTESMQKFMCAGIRCNGTLVCNISDVFAMSTEGPQEIYCNNLEELYGTITVTKLDDGCNVILLGNPSTEFCWFPGYNWTVMLCPKCKKRLGWRFMADPNLKLMPNVFFGLSVNSIKPIKNKLLTERENLN